MFHKEEPSVDVKVDVTKIVKYSCFAAVCIVGIIFGTKVACKQLELEKRK